MTFKNHLIRLVCQTISNTLMYCRKVKTINYICYLALPRVKAARKKLCLRKFTE